MEKLKRYLIFLAGLFVNSFGVSFITRASLGTSPISSIPYVLSLRFPFTLGEFTIAFSILLILLQLLILRKNFHLEHILQIPVSIIFGYFIDLTMLLLGWLNPGSYPMKILSLLIGCVILAFGVYMEVLANVVMLPGESFVRAVSSTWKLDFGNTKVAFDASMTIIAGVLSLLFWQRLEGVREGTVIAALLVGFIARQFGRLFSFLPPLLFPGSSLEEKAASAGNASGEGNMVIAIGRQYACGGHPIGQELARRLGWDFYDGEVIRMAAGTTGYAETFVREQEERMTGSLLYDLMNQMYAYSADTPSPKDAIFAAEEAAIRQLAQKGNCVIVGHCCDHVLRENPNCFRAFLACPAEKRARRLMEKKSLTEKEALSLIAKEDRHRRDNYQYYTRNLWGYAGNYHIMLDTELDIDSSVDLLLSAFQRFRNLAEKSKKPQQAE